MLDISKTTPPASLPEAVESKQSDPEPIVDVERAADVSESKKAQIKLASGDT